MSIKYKLIQKVNPREITAPRKYYASAIHEKTISMKELARETAAYSTTASEGDTYAVLIILRDLIRKYLGNSDTVHIEGIGRFSINLHSEGADSEEDFHPSFIKGVKILFQPDTEMKEHLFTLKYEKYISKIK